MSSWHRDNFTFLPFNLCLLTEKTSLNPRLLIRYAFILSFQNKRKRTAREESLCKEGKILFKNQNAFVLKDKV
jgi:hypothetical protein